MWRHRTQHRGQGYRHRRRQRAGSGRDGRDLRQRTSGTDQDRRERSAPGELRYGPGRDGRGLRQRTSGTDQGETGEVCVRGPQVRTRARRERSASDDLRYGPGRDGRDLRQRTSGTGRESGAKWGLLKMQRRFVPIMMAAFIVDDPTDAGTGPDYIFLSLTFQTNLLLPFRTATKRKTAPIFR